MMKASIKWFAVCMAAASSVAGCGSLRQGESTSRCTDCATALYRDSGSGGSIYNLASASEEAVGRVARRYCAEHGLGQPTIGKRYTPPMGTDFWGYDFSCEVAGAPQAQQPVGSDATQGKGPSLQQQLRHAQREQAIQVMHQALDRLSVQAPSQCESPVTMTMTLPCGDVVSCTKKGDQVNCDQPRDDGGDGR